MARLWLRTLLRLGWEVHWIVETARTVEHGGHILHLPGIKIDRLIEIGRTIKHTSHPNHIAGVEVHRLIETARAREHVPHVHNIGSLQFQRLNEGHCICKHPNGGGQPRRVGEIHCAVECSHEKIYAVLLRSFSDQAVR